jgi:hypothetical protein
MSVSIRLRRDSAERWLENDPVLFQGELGADLTNKKLKLGDGFNEWSKLPYLNSEGLEEIRSEYGNETDFELYYEMFKLDL